MKFREYLYPYNFDFENEKLLPHWHINRFLNELKSSEVFTLTFRDGQLWLQFGGVFKGLGFRKYHFERKNAESSQRTLKEFPRHNYFDLICSFDVVVFTHGALPAEIDVYCLFNEDRTSGIKLGIIQHDSHVYVLERIQQTFIGGINPFRKEDLSKQIVGIGGTLNGFPNWYKALEAEATLTLLDANDQPILSSISKFYTPIGCYIPNCTSYIGLEGRYWYAHSDSNYPQLTLQNFDRAKTHTLVDFGFGYNVLFALDNGKERRVTIPIELYSMIFDSIDRSNHSKDGSSLNESLIFLAQSPNGKHYKLTDSKLVSSSVLSRVNLRTLETRRNLVNVFTRAIIERRRPNLVLISPKGTFKSTFKELLKQNGANVGVIDSDDFGDALTIEYFKRVSVQFSSVETGNFIINWFRSRFPEFEISKEIKVLVLVYAF